MLQASPIRVGTRVLVAQYSNKPEISARPVRVRAPFPPSFFIT